MTFLVKDSSITRIFFVTALIALMSVTVACERSPDDLEEWRGASGGIAQLSDWATDESEPMEVRLRAVEIIVEEGGHDRLPGLFDEIEDEELRQKMANGAMPAVIAQWEEQDVPELTDEMRESGAKVPIKDYQTAHAIDSIYRLAPYLGDEETATAQEILRDWMSRDQELRTQLTQTPIPFLVPFAGDGAIDLLSDWIIDTYDPSELTSALRKHAPDDAHHVIDTAVGERARKMHPEITPEMKQAIAGAESDGIAPYLEEVIADETIEDELFQIAINKLVDVRKDEAAAGLATVVEHQGSPRRWAAATNIIDARGVAGLQDIAAALPTAADEYSSGSDDEIHSRFNYLCNYLNTNIEEDTFELDIDALTELMAMEGWPAQALGLTCVSRLGATEAGEAVESLRGKSTRIPAWGEPKSVGQLATDVAGEL